MGHGAVDVAGLVKRVVDAISGRVRVERVILFGSRARGEANEGSDVDLLVVSPDFGGDVPDD